MIGYSCQSIISYVSSVPLATLSLQAFVCVLSSCLSQLFYSNSLLVDFPHVPSESVELHIMCRARGYTVSLLLRFLYWLLICSCIQYKLSSYFNFFAGSCPISVTSSYHQNNHIQSRDFTVLQNSGTHTPLYINALCSISNILNRSPYAASPLSNSFPSID